MKQWQCSVCKYIHTGDEPPEKCPVCGADKSKFVEIEQQETDGPKEAAVDSGAEKESPPSRPDAPGPEKEPAPSPPDGRGARLIDFALSRMVKHHIHPISVHIPNGVLPVSVILIFIAAIFNIEVLAMAAFYNMVFVLLSLPLVLLSGFNEWKRKYSGIKSGVFMTKIVCAGIVLATTLISVLWSVFEPLAALPGSANRGLFLALHLVMLAAAGLSGFIGGKLVFKD